MLTTHTYVINNNLSEVCPNTIRLIALKALLTAPVTVASKKRSSVKWNL